MATSQRLLVLALDAASPSLLRRWAASGDLPHLAALLERGLSADTRGVDGFYVGATWPSFYTGCGPAVHGLYWLDRLRPGTYRVQAPTPADFARQPALWEVLSQAGRRVLVLDVPLTRLSPGLRGGQLREWGVHDETFGFGARPRALGRSVRRLVGDHPVPASCDAPRRSAAEYRAFADDLARGAAARAKLTRSLLESRPWDFAIQVFSETHCAGHQLWHFHDPEHPAHRPGDDDLLFQVYQAVDRAVGEILDALDEDVTVALVSLHSMGSTCGASLLLPEILERLDVYHPQGTRPRASAPDAGRGPADPAPSGSQGWMARLRGLYHGLPEGLRRPVYDLRQVVNQRVLRRGSPLGFDPTRSRAFPVGLGLGAPLTGIRLNLRGREPQGILAPGAEAQAFVQDLEGRLMGLVYAEGGLPVVRALHRTAALHRGPRLEELPDLLVEWHETPALGTTVAGTGEGAECRVHSEAVGTVARTNRYGRTGEHRQAGLLVLAGPGLPRGSLDGPISTLDLAPTFAGLLGCAMPSAQGRPLALEPR